MSKYVKPNESGLFDKAMRLEELHQMGDPLARLDEVIDWSLFEPVFARILGTEPEDLGGRPSFAPRFMFQALGIASLYQIGDLPLQFQITDRLSFKRILWRTHADQSPDGKTFRAFRETLITHDLLKPLFDIFHAALEPKGMAAGKGQRVDATFVEVPRQRNAREEHATINAGEVPAAWRDEPEKVPPEGRGRALDASKNDARHSGYKNHVKVDSRVQTH